MKLAWAASIDSFSDTANYKLLLDGKVHHFDFSEICGPVFVDANGKEVSSQNRRKALEAISLWHRQGKRTCPNGFIVWHPKATEIFHFIHPRVAKFANAIVLQNDRCA